MSNWGTRPSPFSSAEVTALRALIGGGVSYTDGQLLIGSTADGLLHAATLTAGSNVTITNSGGGISIAAASGSGLTVGTTAIGSGTNTRILYDNAGTLGEYTISGSGTVVAMATSPAFTTPALGVATATSLAIGGATLGSNGLAVTGHLLLEGVTSTGATGTNLLVFATSPTLTTPVLGAATATSINGLTITSSTGTLTVTNLKTVSFSNAITFAGTDSTTMTFPASSATVAGLGISQTFTGIQTFSPTARTSGSASYLTVNAPADTGLATTVESIGINHVGATRTWVDGTVAAQREYLFQAPTYNKTTTSATFTKAATLAITAGPTAGTGVTITSAYALWVQAGIAQLDGTLVVAGHVTLEGVTSTGATGTNLLVFATSPTLTTPVLGAATATTINGNTFTTGTYTLTGQAGKTLTFNGTITLTGTDAQTYTFPTTSATIARIDAANTFTGTQTITTIAGLTTVTGAASNMTITAGTGASRTLILQTTTSGSTATTALTLNADQTATFAAGATIGGTLAMGANSITISGSIGVTGTRVTKGWFTDVESTNVPTVSGTALPTLAANQTWTGQDKFNNIIDVNNAVSVTTNAGTVPVTFRLNTFTNSSAATMAITMATASAVDGQMTIVRIYDFSGVAQTIGWTNTEDSTVAAPTTSNGSTTLPLTVGFMFNSQTTKWRCIAKA